MFPYEDSKTDMFPLWVLHEYYAMETQKLDFFFQKSSKFEFWQQAEITLASSISVLH